MTKEQKIQEEYGEYWEKLSDDNKNKALKGNGFISQYYENILPKDYERKNFMIRPKSLSGIENNNGWEKYDYEKLLEDQDYHVITEDGVIVVLSSNVINSISKNSLVNITHYKPIEKPKPPIY